MGRPAFVRQRILEAAFDLMACEGYEAVSTRAIAVRAKVGPASMFRHFPTKESLGRELYRVALAPVLLAFTGLASTIDAPTAITQTVRILYQGYDSRPRALALLVFPPHELTPWEVDPQNPATPRQILQRHLSEDADLTALVWGAIIGPLQDRYLRRRDGAMAPLCDTYAIRICRLLSPAGSTA